MSFYSKWYLRKGQKKKKKEVGLGLRVKIFHFSFRPSLDYKDS